MASDLISREALEKDMRAYADRTASCGHIELANGILKAVCRIAEFPAIDAEPVLHGEWLPWIEEVEIYNAGGMTEPRQVGWLCSKCKKGRLPMHRRRCPDCGAKMDGGKQDD